MFSTAFPGVIRRKFQAWVERRDNHIAKHFYTVDCSLWFLDFPSTIDSIFFFFNASLLKQKKHRLSNVVVARFDLYIYAFVPCFISSMTHFIICVCIHSVIDDSGNDSE
jgi:hypothetical protein